MKVTLFSAENCSGCVRVKKFLLDHEINFDEINLTLDPEKAITLRDTAGIMSVPVTVVENGKQKEIVVGFNKAKLNELLKFI